MNDRFNNSTPLNVMSAMTRFGGKMIGLAIVGGLLLVLVLWMITGYNALVRSRENVNRQWSAVQSDYQRRSDLIPNLVETVKGAASFEQETLTQVINARARATQITVNPENAQDLQNFQQAQGELGSALSRLLVVAEQYPQLQAVQAFRDLQNQLEGTENRISVSRKDYGTAVSDYNIKRSRFPTVLIAGIFGFNERPYFEADDGAQDAPSVDFGNSSTPAATAVPAVSPSPVVSPSPAATTAPATGN